MRASFDVRLFVKVHDWIFNQFISKLFKKMHASQIKDLSSLTNVVLCGDVAYTTALQLACQTPANVPP